MPIEPIAHVRSPYRQKFAIPRQPRLVPQAEGEVVFEPAYADPNALRGLEEYSHLWLLFLFHATAQEGWSPTVTPPRLGGRQRVGVFATRSMYRPNPLGLSLVEFGGIEQRDGVLILRVRGIDLLDGTPIVDIKPYLPWADAVAGASAGFAPDAPGPRLRVVFSDAARSVLADLDAARPGLEAFIRAVLEQDPRPAQHARGAPDREFGTALHDLNIRWRVTDDTCHVLAIEALDEALLRK